LDEVQKKSGELNLGKNKAAQEVDMLNNMLGSNKDYVSNVNNKLQVEKLKQEKNSLLDYVEEILRKQDETTTQLG
jgi:lipopolysaccharide biosynthesis regulator YciM